MKKLVLALTAMVSLVGLVVLSFFMRAGPGLPRHSLVVFNHASNWSDSPLYVSEVGGRITAVPMSSGTTMAELTSNGQGVTFVMWKRMLASRGRALKLVAERLDGNQRSVAGIALGQESPIESELGLGVLLSISQPPAQWVVSQSDLRPIKRLTWPTSATAARKRLILGLQGMKAQSEQLRSIVIAKGREMPANWSYLGGGRFAYINGRHLVVVSKRGSRTYDLGKRFPAARKEFSDRLAMFSNQFLWVLTGKKAMAYVIAGKRIYAVEIGGDSVKDFGLPGKAIGASVSPDRKWMVCQPWLEFPPKGYKHSGSSSPGAGAKTALGGDLDGSSFPLSGYYLVNLITGDRQHVLKGKAVGTVKWFPDSKRFIARTGKKRTDLGVVDIRRPNEIKVFLHDVNQWDVWFPPAKGGK